MFKILKFKQQLVSSGFLEYPINELDEKYYTEHGKPPAGKYAKMLGRATPIANRVWKQSLTVKSKLHDAGFITKYPVTDRSFYYFVELVAALDIEVQELNKEIKKTKQEAELAEYYTQFADILKTNFFVDILAPDIDSMLHKGTEIVATWQENTPAHPDLMVDQEDVLSYYKSALKSAKEARKKLTKLQEENK